MIYFRVELPSGPVLEGELVTVALAFLMHEYADVGMQAESTVRALVAAATAGDEAATAPDGVESGDELPDELVHPERYAHLTGEIGDDDGTRDSDR